MQILGAAGTSNVNSRLSTTSAFAGVDAQSARRAPHSSNEMSQANSAMSIECDAGNSAVDTGAGGIQMTSTIDLKVDVHRKNSSESSDSLAEQCSGGADAIDNKKTLHLPLSMQSEGNHFAMFRQNMQAMANSDEMMPEYTEDSKLGRNMAKRDSMKTKSKSEDASATVNMDYSMESRSDKFVDMEHLAGNRCESHKRRMRMKLQRQTSLDYFATKSELAMESFPSENGTKIYALQRKNAMRKDPSSTMSAIQLGTSSAGPSSTSNARRQSVAVNNSTKQQMLTGIVSVRRIKSTALDRDERLNEDWAKSGQQNLPPHPSSVEAIGMQPLKHSHAELPLPGKGLIRNQHSIGTASSTTMAAAKTENLDQFFRMFHLKEAPVDNSESESGDNEADNDDEDDDDDDEDDDDDDLEVLQPISRCDTR